jgi:hypothetical protein
MLFVGEADLAASRHRQSGNGLGAIECAPVAGRVDPLEDHSAAAAGYGNVKTMSAAIKIQTSLPSQGAPYHAAKANATATGMVTNQNLTSA